MSRKASKEFIANMKMFRVEQIKQALVDEKALVADGFEDALIGHTQGPNLVAVYDYDMCVHVLMERDGMTCEEAVEYMDFNVTGSYVGEKTPIFISLV